MRETDVARLRAWFASYCRPFYGGSAEDDRNIALKEEHTSCVCANMELITQSLGLDAGTRHLAAGVALLHDVGRFEQYRRYKTFRDRDSVNHAAFGARVLVEDDVLGFLPAGQRRLILRAVTLHNVFALPAGLDERLDLLVRLVRDADKLDIWRVFAEYFGQPEEERASAAALGFPDTPTCSPAVVEALLAGRIVELSQVATLNDFRLLQLSWVYDLNFAPACALALERSYLRHLAAGLPSGKDVERAVAAATAFLEQRCAP